MTKKRIEELSYFTTIMCFCVILIHLTAAPVTKLTAGSLPQTLFFVLNKGISFVVPGFVFLSGLKLAYTYRDREFHIGEFFRKRVKRIFFPYLFWYIVFYRYFLWQHFMEPKTLSQHLFSFVMGNLVSPFYFITVIFQLYFLFGFILYLFQKVSHKWILLAAVIFSFFYFRFCSFPYQDRFFATYLIYFLSGVYAAFHLDDFRELCRRYQGIICILYLSVTVYYVWKAYASFVYGAGFGNFLLWQLIFSMIAIPFYYRLSCLLSKLLQGLAPVFQAIDSASYNIFLSHCIVIYIGDYIWYKWGYTSIVNKFLFTGLLLLLTVFPVCIGYDFLKKRLRRKIN